MRFLCILVMGLFAGTTAISAEDHNSTRSNEGQVTPPAPPTSNGNTTKSGPATQADVSSDGDSADDAGREAGSGMATGKRQHSPL